MHTEDLRTLIRSQLAGFETRVAIDEIGTIVSVGDGIARLSGLSKCMAGEMLLFPNGSYGLALALEEHAVSCVVLGDYHDLRAGDTVSRSRRLLEVPVGQALLGRVVDPLGRPLDGKGPINAEATRRVESPAPGLADRVSVHEPLQTGLKAIDALTPVGRGQRELVIGDRRTGKTAICTDTILNQKDSGVICLYVAIGQKESAVAGIVKQLSDAGAMDYSIVVSAAASASAPLHFLAPYAACAMAEFFMYQTWEQGPDGRPLLRDGRYVPQPLAEGGRGMACFIAYDDLGTHAGAYREMSLLLRRPPGREAYPGDVFYLHSRLLERAAKLAPRLGGGSLTAFPVIATQEGDVSAYIPSNVISITDGHIYVQPELFNVGVRPAIDVAVSMSRVGGAAQIPAMRQVAGALRHDLVAYREAEELANMGAELDIDSRRQLERGARMIQLLTQAQGQPMAVAVQVLVLKAAGQGLLDDVEASAVSAVMARWQAFLEDGYPELIEMIRRTGTLDATQEGRFREALGVFRAKSNVAGAAD